jgi:hypothetical protein
MIYDFMLVICRVLTKTYFIMDGEHEDNYTLHGRIVSRSTYYRWRAANRDDIPSSNSSGSNHSSSSSTESSSKSSSTSSSTPPVTRIVEYSNSSSEASSENLSERQSYDGVDVGIEHEVEFCPGVEPELDTWANIGFVDGRIPEPAPTGQDLAQVIENEVVGLQHDMDNANVPITVQEKIFKIIFKKRLEENHGQPQNYKGMGLGQLITFAGKNNIKYFFILLFMFKFFNI